MDGNQVIAPGYVEGERELSKPSIDFDIAVTSSETDGKSKDGGKISIVSGEMSKGTEFKGEKIYLKKIS